jgi:hypothetical protein
MATWGAAAAEVASGLLSIRKNAVVTVGGEIHVDYAYRRAPDSGSRAAFALRRTNLRVRADVHPAVSVFFKLDLGDKSEPDGEKSSIFEEAMLVLHSVAGAGVEVFAGKGGVPYGQDVALGMLQSYHHHAHREDSPEGRIFIIDPTGDEVVPDPNDPASRKRLPPMRPGPIDRAVMAGAAYQWEDRWRVEAAVFQTNGVDYARRLEGKRDNGADHGFSARLWWRPLEDLTLQASAMVAHSSSMGDASRRLDLADGARATENSWSASVGFDWRRDPWMFFGEYQHGWNSNFSNGYAVDIAQLGAARAILPGKRLGLTAEWQRIDSGGRNRREDDFFKAAATFRCDISAGAYIILEWGREWHRGRRGAGGAIKENGTFLGMRVGLNY